MVSDFIQANPVEAGQIALSLALVIVTGIYTYFTYSQTKQMKKTREVSNQPVLQGSVITHAPTIVVAEFRNTGNIAAHNVSENIRFKDLDTGPLEFAIPILSPDEDYRFRLPLDDTDKALWKMEEAETILEDEDASGTLVFEFCFENPFGTEYCRTNTVNVLDWLNKSPYAVGYAEKEKSRAALEDIGSRLDDISDKM